MYVSIYLSIQFSITAAEEVVCRCIERCTDLHLQPLASQATIYLARYRSQIALTGGIWYEMSSPRTVISSLTNSQVGDDQIDIRCLSIYIYITFYNLTLYVFIYLYLRMY
jgi:hypothetical protein